MSEEQALHDGVTYELRNTDDSSSIQMHILRVDPTKVRIRPMRRLNDSLDQTISSSIQERGDAIASIRGLQEKITPILKMNNEWQSIPYTPSGACAWSELNPELLIDRVLAEGHVRIGEGIIRFGKLNTDRNSSDVVLYTPSFHRSTDTRSTDTSPGGKDLIIKQNRLIEITEVVNDTAIPSDIPSDGFVLSLGPRSPYINTSYPIDTSCAYRIYVTPLIDPTQSSRKAWDNAQHVLGGSTPLIKSGKPISLPPMPLHSETLVRETVPSERYTRIAIGTLGNGIWVFVVIDDSSALHSHDITIIKLQQFMLSLGCLEALCLGGDLPTTMTIQNKVITVPSTKYSDGKDKCDISDGVIILPR